MTNVDRFIVACRRRNLSPGTIATRVHNLALFDAWAPRGIDRATAEDIEAFLDARRWHGKPIAPKTRYVWISHLASYYSWCVRRGLLSDDPTAMIDRPELEPSLPRPIDDDDLAAALASAGRQMHLWLLLAALGGLRIAEIAGLRAECIRGGSMRVIGKGRKERVVPAHPTLSAALDDWRGPRLGRMFLRPHGGAYSPAFASREVSLFFNGLGMPWTAHNLRHWFGTKTLESCGDLRVVQELMGHANPATTAIYTRVSIERSSVVVGGLVLPRVASAGASPAA